MIKEYKVKYLIENIKKLVKILYCFDYTDEYRVLDTSGMKYVNAISEQLEIIGSKHTNFSYKTKTYKNFGMDKYKAAGEMFIYLTQCPKFMFEWTQLYVDLLQNASPDVIVQALNRIMITGRMKGHNIVTDIARNIFAKVSNKLSLTFPEVDKFTILTNSTQTNGIKEKKTMNTKIDLKAAGLVSNHPVHMYDEDGKMSPSAFIPFCNYGRRISTMGDIMGNYDLPVCKSFKPKVRNLQLCYEVDLDEYRNRDNIVKDLKSGLVFFMDYNEDRQIALDGNAKVYHDNFVDKVDASKDEESAFIYLNTIGKEKNVILIF